MDYKNIKEVVCNSHGGMESADKENILIFWNSLTLNEKEEHIQAKKTKGKKNAVSAGAKPNI